MNVDRPQKKTVNHENTKLFSINRSVCVCAREKVKTAKRREENRKEWRTDDEIIMVFLPQNFFRSLILSLFHVVSD